MRLEWDIKLGCTNKINLKGDYYQQVYFANAFFCCTVVHLRSSTFVTVIGSKAECFKDTNSQREGIHHVKSWARTPGVKVLKVLLPVSQVAANRMGEEPIVPQAAEPLFSNKLSVSKTNDPRSQSIIFIPKVFQMLHTIPNIYCETTTNNKIPHRKVEGKKKNKDFFTNYHCTESSVTIHCSQIIFYTGEPYTEGTLMFRWASNKRKSVTRGFSGGLHTSQEYPLFYSKLWY